jgi:hypothetical protein
MQTANDVAFLIRSKLKMKRPIAASNANPTAGNRQGTSLADMVASKSTATKSASDRPGWSLMDAVPPKSAAMQRANNRQWALKPQDLAVLFKLVALGGQWLPYQEMAKRMYLSQFETHAAMQRLVACRLARTDEDGSVRPIMQVLYPFVLYGAAYVYPAVRTDITIGFVTAYGAAPMKEHVLYADEFPPVWPHAEGTVRGPGLLPLYENAPLAARDDNTLAQMMTLFDALRIGQAREREKAGELLAARLR